MGDIYMNKTEIFTGCPQHGARLSKDMRYEVRCAICASKAIANLCDYIAVLEAKLEHVASVTAGVFENMADDLEPEKKPDPVCTCNHRQSIHRWNAGESALECFMEVGSYYCRCSEFKPKEPEAQQKPFCNCGHWRERHVGNDGICMQENCGCISFK
jgi:hypothetical protein